MRLPQHNTRHATKQAFSRLNKERARASQACPQTAGHSPGHAISGVAPQARIIYKGAARPIRIKQSYKYTVRSVSIILSATVLALCLSCGHGIKVPGIGDGDGVRVCRFDRLESRYLSTGDFSALQQMETDYPMETKTLIENVLRIGIVEDQKINNKFLVFFQDSVLQTLIGDAEAEYANMDDINEQLTAALSRLQESIPSIQMPKIYAQISALDQSIVVGENSIGISLDKYLGENYPLYFKYYDEEQRRQMTRANIVPDCLSFYLLSIYPLHDFETRTQQDRDMHTAKVMWVCNQLMQSSFFTSESIDTVARYMQKNSETTMDELLRMDDFAPLRQ